MARLTLQPSLVFSQNQVARAIATTKASMLHAVTSSTAAAGRGGASERRLENTAVLQDTNQHREGGDAHGDPHEQGEGEK